MDQANVLFDVVGHLAATVAFLGVAGYVTVRRRLITRTVRRSRTIYWLMLFACLLFALTHAARLVSLFTRGMSSLPAWPDLVSDYPSLIGQGLVIVALTHLQVVGTHSAARRRILAVGAHPDDIEIACGATLAKMRDEGSQVWGLVMTQGEKGGNGHIRPCEAQRGAEFLGLDHMQIFDLPDTRLQERAQDVHAVIERVIREFKPDLILTHSPHDLHQDHRTVHEATLRASCDFYTILCYESPSVTQEFTPTFFSNIGDYLDVKVEGIREHWDQRSKPYVQEERVRGTAVFRGGQARLRYAEGFEVIHTAAATRGEA